MRFINVYLIGYFILVIGALAALWYGGALRHICGAWIVIGLVIAVGLGHHAVGLSRQARNHSRIAGKPATAAGVRSRSRSLAVDVPRSATFENRMAHPAVPRRPVRPYRHGTACEYLSALMSGRVSSARATVPVSACLLAAAACKEEGGVKVTSFTFNGTKAVTPAQLKSVLATSASSKNPLGTKHYFSRDQFEADLKRIVAFYQDRGYPDARVTSFDAKLNAGSDLGRHHGQHRRRRADSRRARRTSNGFERCPTASQARSKRRLPLKVGQPLDRALLQASREAALDELKDHGYPYAPCRSTETPGTSDRAAGRVARRPTRARSRTSARLRSAATPASATTSSGGS